jgi:hypothetical protein
VEFLIVLVVLAVVVFVVTGPLRRAPAAAEDDAEAAATARSNELAELEAAREAKYREIRDAELDHETGKLSDGDFQAIDSTLRAEALDILRAIDQTSSADSQAARYHRRT